VRITTQLVNGVTGFHLWSETYDRDLTDVLKLQTEIASAVASALKVTLLGDVATRVQSGGTRSPAAFDAYLRGTKAYTGRHVQRDLDAAIGEYTKAIELDTNYALAYVARSRATVEKENFAGLGPHDLDNAKADANRAIALARELGEGYAALAEVQVHGYEFTRADEAYKRALALAPGSVHVLQAYSWFSAIAGRFEASIDAARRAVQLDPLNVDSHWALSTALLYARRYQESNATYQDVLTLDPEFADPYQWTLGYMVGHLEETRKRCEKHPDTWGSQVCLAIIYEKLGRHADAESQLARLRASNPKENDWYQYAEIYAQWGNVSKALEFLENTMRSHHVGIVSLKVDTLLDPVRNEPRFQAIERELKFPK
jgi:tetratricopeptide (TPR) repeat protein